MATCLRACASKRASARRREAAPAEAGNAAGGFFQQTLKLSRSMRQGMATVRSKVAGFHAPFNYA